MRGIRPILLICGSLLALWLGLSAGAGVLLPDHLLHPGQPVRTEAQAAQLRARLAAGGGEWRSRDFAGSDGAALRMWRLHRPSSRGVVLYLHGFGDDAFGTVGYAAQLPGWDAAAFTFRGRDRDPSALCTLGAREAGEVVAAVRLLESEGLPRRRIVIAGTSQGAGVALLALAQLEQEGGPLAGALLESPFLDLRDAARNHVRGLLGRAEPLGRLAERIALARAGRMAGFDPDRVSPRLALRGLRTPLAFLAGKGDPVTPLPGVRTLAEISGSPLTVVVCDGHCEAGARVPGGWGGWARGHLDRWETQAGRAFAKPLKNFLDAPAEKLE